MNNIRIKSILNSKDPVPSKLADESYLDFVETFRDIAGYRNYPLVAQQADKKISNELGKIDHKTPIKEIKKIINKIPFAATWQRFMRSHQEMMWRRTRESFSPLKDKIISLMEEAANSPNSKLTIDKDFKVPEYAREEIHLQPGGYTDDPLGGIVYHYGTKVFYAGTNDNDEIHAEICETLTLPKDQKINNVLDIGCSIGQATILLKDKFPDAKVIGLDVGEPLLKYANWRAMKLKKDVYFKQGLSEDTKFNDNSFDVVLSYILFHEIPVEVIKKTVDEIYRIVRPGGTFCIYEFPSASEKMPASQRWMIDYDSINNCEPYSPGFVYLDFKEVLTNAGFILEPGPKNSNMFLQTITAIKPK